MFKWAFIGLLVLPAVEVVGFLLMAALIGSLWAGILVVATSLLGLALIRRYGRRDLARLRDALARNGIRATRLDTPGLAPMIGAMLLIFPGFITDVLGAALFVPAFRRWAAGALVKVAIKRSRRGRNDIVDLEPGEWHQIQTGSPRRKYNDEV